MDEVRAVCRDFSTFRLPAFKSDGWPHYQDGPIIKTAPLSRRPHYQNGPIIKMEADLMIAEALFPVVEEEDIYLWDVAAGLAMVKGAGGTFELLGAVPGSTKSGRQMGEFEAGSIAVD